MALTYGNYVVFSKVGALFQIAAKGLPARSPSRVLSGERIGGVRDHRPCGDPPRRISSCTPRPSGQLGLPTLPESAN